MVLEFWRRVYKTHHRKEWPNCALDSVSASKRGGKVVRLFVITEAEFDRRALQKCEIYGRELGSI